MNQKVPVNNNLSDRELEVLQLVATGASNKEIAHQLEISQNTVKVHIRNIFGKVGVASRTEAAMYAVQAGLVQTPASTQVSSEQELKFVEQIEMPFVPPQSWWLRRGGYLFAFIGVVIVLGVIGLSFNVFRNPADLGTPEVLPSAQTTQWQSRSPLRTPRLGLGVAVNENVIYAVGGETQDGVSEILERFDPQADEWELLSDKPTPVADIRAAQIGGQIFVPGGRLENGEITDVLEIYDPGTDQWHQGKPLPLPRSEYAAVAFEGHLFLFGGWNGTNYVPSVFEYDPGQDVWQERTAMPTSRGQAGATVAGGRIYVIGGTNGNQALANNEGYLPSLDLPGDVPWEIYSPMPEGRFGMGVVSIVDTIQIIGGEGEQQMLSSLRYSTLQDEWQSYELQLVEPWSRMGMVVVGTDLHAIGGQEAGAVTGQHLTYQALFTISIPVIK